jgi:hypothetical protein
LNSEKCIQCPSNGVSGRFNIVTITHLQQFRDNYHQFVSPHQFSTLSLNPPKSGTNTPQNQDFIISQGLFSIKDLVQYFKDSQVLQKSGLNEISVGSSSTRNIKNLYLALKSQAGDCQCPFYTHVVSGI